jgi:hypothetical protein
MLEPGAFLARPLASKADESTTGPASLMLFDRSRLRLPAVDNEPGKSADLRDQLEKV